MGAAPVAATETAALAEWSIEQAGQGPSASGSPPIEAERASVRRPPGRSNTVFLNIPYDEEFGRLYVAYVVGLVYLGLDPQVTLGIPGGKRRLDRILALIGSCRYSIHDLSRVELDRTAPRTPRFNMPFELGLAVGWAAIYPSHHEWFLFETVPWRAAKSISDVNGTDPNIHRGTVQGVMRELCNAFVRTQPKPSVPEMLRAYRLVSRQLPETLKTAGGRTIFEARIFNDLRVNAGIAAERVRSQPARRRRE